MKCQLIQIDKVNEENRGEKEFLTFVRNLPENTYVYRELQIAVINRVRDVEKKKPDFVIVSPWAGVISVEVKDWNIITNQYEWQDQNHVIVHHPDGTTKTIDNPVAQANAYLYALMEVLPKHKIYVTSLNAFPRINRSDFLNRVSNPGIFSNPQSRFYLDLDKTIFKEDMDQFWNHPEKLFKQILSKDSKFKTCTQNDVEETNRYLMPPSFRIGDFKQREVNQRRLRVINQQQQKWIFGLDPKKNYLLDVAGSGKTNALISKAIHLVDRAKDGVIPQILLTTYSHNLEINIRNIFNEKISDDQDKNRYQDAIAICCIPHLMEQMVASFLEMDRNDFRDQLNQGNQLEYEKKLKDELRGILSSSQDRYRKFDYVFVDEIQDFDNEYLYVVESLCKDKKFFFVGDLGQKIYDRTHNLERLGFITEYAELDKSYKMYRTPKYIAELSTLFILGDSETKRELENHGYGENYQYPNQSDNLAALKRSFQLEKDCVELIDSYLKGGVAEEDILVITSLERINQIKNAFNKKGFPFEIGEASNRGCISLVDFMNVKGLEKEVVIILGIEDLYHRGKVDGLFQFDDENEKLLLERFSRRKIYVSLTRTIEYVTVFYTDPHNRFIQELTTLNQRIIQKRQQGL